MNCRCLGANSRLFRRLFPKNMYSSHQTVEKGPVVQEHGFTHCNSHVHEHGVKDHLKVHSIPKDLAKGPLVNALPKAFKEISSTVGDYGMLLRKPSLSIVEDIHEYLEDKQVKKYLLFGEDGNGKEMIMLHLLYYCLTNHWLIIHVPNAFGWNDSQHRTEVRRSTWNDTRYDQPTEAGRWLQTFANLNTTTLQKLTTSKQYTWGARESTSEGSPLIDVVNQGIGREGFSTDAIGVLLKEIALQKNTKVLYAVNGVNAFFSKTSHKFKDKFLNVEDLSLVRHFTKFLNKKHSFNQGACIMTLSQSSHYAKERVPNEDFKQILCGDMALELFSDYENVKVDRYAEDEYDVIMKYYKHRGWLAADLSDKLRNEVLFMTQRRPENVAKICAAL